MLLGHTSRYYQITKRDKLNKMNTTKTNKLKCIFTPHYNESKNRTEYAIKRSDRVIPHQTEWCTMADRGQAISEMLKQGYIVEIRPLTNKEWEPAVGGLPLYGNKNK